MNVIRWSVLVPCVCALVAAVVADDSVVQRYGFGPGRVGLEASGWYADNLPVTGHATDFEDEFDYSRTTIGLINNFVRAYFGGGARKMDQEDPPDISSYPGIGKPGRIVFRMRRKGDSSKVIVSRSPGHVATMVTVKYPEKDRYCLTRLGEPVYVEGDRAWLNRWHDYIIEYDGRKLTGCIDGDTGTRFEFPASTDTVNAGRGYLSFGMGYEYGSEMYMDFESLRFEPLTKPYEPLPATAQVPDGRYVRKHTDGTAWIECTIVDGRPHGAITRYYRNGERKGVGAYAKGLRHGLWTWWHPNGTVRLRRRYEEGKPVGQYVRYYPDGQLETTTRFRGGLAHGLFARWFPDGRPQFTGLWRDGKRQGYWAKWGEDGMHWEHMTVDNQHDEFVRTYYPTGGSLKTYWHVRKGVMDGAYVEYHPNGKIKSQGQYRDGQKVGVWTTCDENGAVVEEVDEDPATPEP